MLLVRLSGKEWRLDAASPPFINVASIDALPAKLSWLFDLALNFELPSSYL
jgi:hypothetical protein